MLFIRPCSSTWCAWGPVRRFVVVGSTGKHYVIFLSNERRRCQCPDHRIRQHDCKHIRLVLEQLGIASHTRRLAQGAVIGSNKTAHGTAHDVKYHELLVLPAYDCRHQS